MAGKGNDDHLQLRNASSSIADRGAVSVSIYLRLLYTYLLLSASRCTWPCPLRPFAHSANLYLRTWRNTRAPVYKWAHHANPLEHSDHIGGAKKFLA